MRLNCLAPLVLLAAVAVVGAEKNEIPAELLAIFEKAESITLFSVSPAYAENGDFHKYKTLGKVEVTKADEKKKLLEAVKGTLQTGPDFTAMKCFEPRHGLRATVNGKTADLLICFECHQAYAYDGTDKDAKSTYLYVNTNARAALNKMLTDGGVALAPSGKSKE